MTHRLATPPIASILAWEAVSSLGESAAETSLLLRAGLSNVEQSRFIDQRGDRVLLCASPALAGQLDGTERLVALASLALHRLCMKLRAAWAPDGPPARLHLLLALPDRLALQEGRFELGPQGRSFIDALRLQLPDELREAELESFPFGRAAGALAMRRAQQLLHAGDAVIWGGVDTLHDWPVLQALERAGRLITLDNVDGVRPGEGAAFAWLGTPGRRPGGLNVVGIGLGREPCPVTSDAHSHSSGITTALAAAIEPLRQARMRSNWWLLDTTHETYGTQELQNVIARFGDVLGLSAELQTPLKELGDVGAAAIPMLTVLGAEAWERGVGTDSTAIVTGSSDPGARGALLLACASLSNGASS